MLNAALEDGREFLCAGRFTLADICVAWALFMGTTLAVDGKPLSSRYKPQVKEYMERMMARSGWAEAQRAQAASAEKFSTAQL